MEEWRTHQPEMVSGLNGSFHREHSKKTGSYYTPHHIANNIVNTTIGRWIKEHHNLSINRLSGISEKRKEDLRTSLMNIRILDPSVGDGIFLRTAGNLLESLYQQIEKVDSRAKLRERIVESSLYGIDIQKSAVEDCQRVLAEWVGEADDEYSQRPSNRIRLGNTLIGKLNDQNGFDYSKVSMSFNWNKEFSEVFDNEKHGFDIIVGNPPYGNLLGSIEKDCIRQTLSYDVMSGRTGSWNIAPIFIVRSKDLLNHNGHFGLLVPNSILRVGQFKKTREFIKEQLGLWRIADEGNPFDRVTLEMVSLFCKAVPITSKGIEITSRRPGLEGRNTIQRDVLNNQIISIYADPLFQMIRDRGKTNLISASRGRDIPSKYTTNQPSRDYPIPYATRGRSVRRYRICDNHLLYTNDWFKQDSALLDSFSNEFIIATKNYPYPRCVFKSKGIVHGGGVVRILPLADDLEMKAIGLILNSRLSRFISTRYLTNYSQLTTCLNTGIVEEIPLVLPDETQPLSNLFDILQETHRSFTEEDVRVIDTFADALVYAIYFDVQNGDALTLLDTARSFKVDPLERIQKKIAKHEMQTTIHRIMNLPIVKKIETSPRME